MTATRRFTAFTVAGTYVGTVVGAGFATGQEVLTFFSHFGRFSIPAIIGAAVLFAFLGARVLKLGYELQAESHRVIVDRTVGPLLGRVLDWVITFFLFAGAAVMMAGSGAILHEHFGMNPFFGAMLMAIVAAITCLVGIKGVVNTIATIAPLLIILVVMVSIASIQRIGLAPGALAYSQPGLAASPFWPVSALLYVSYNILVSIPVLATLGRQADSQRVLMWGGIIGGAMLGLGILFINLAMLTTLPQASAYEVPMLFLARQFRSWVPLIYTVVLWAAVYTTAVSSLYGLAVRLAAPETPRYRLVVITGSLAGLLLSQVGFSTMVNIIFPVVGWLGLIFIFGVFYRVVRGSPIPIR